MGSDPMDPRFMFTAKLEVKYRKNVPTGKPLIINWYTGLAPAFWVVAVKVTGVPAQTVVLVGVEIDTEVTTLGVTVIVMPAEVTLAAVAHIALELSTTVTISPLARLEVVKTGELVPALTPFTFHW